MLAMFTLLWRMQFVGELLDVSCDFEHPFMCGYTSVATGTFSWERMAASDVRYMQKSRSGTMTFCLEYFDAILYCFLVLDIPVQLKP